MKHSIIFKNNFESIYLITEFEIVSKLEDIDICVLCNASTAP